MMEQNSFSEVTPEIVRLAGMSEKAGIIDTELFTKYDVKRGKNDGLYFKRYRIIFFFREIK